MAKKTVVNQKQGTREKLKAVALKLFANQGYTETSTKQICDEAGANIAAVTYHFETKEKLLLAILTEQISENTDVVDRMLKEPESVEAFKIRLRLFCETFLEFRVKNPDFHRLLIQEAFHIPVAFEVFKNAVKAMDSSLVGFLKLAKKNNFIGEDTDVSMLAFLLTQMMTGPRLEAGGRINPAVDILDSKKRAAYLDKMLDLFFHGILNLKEGS